jgi:hypothetical protein
MLNELNTFIIDITKSKKYFTEDQYNKIKNINNECMFDDKDDDITNTLKTDMQHYVFYFLLEYIKLIVSDNNQKKNNLNQLNNDQIFSHAQN